MDLKRIGETGWLRGFAMCEHENTAHLRGFAMCEHENTAHLRLASSWENCNELR